MLGTSKSIWDFDPRNVPNCALWLDGADVSSMTLNGNTVSQWNDKSGNGYNVVQATSGNQPTLGTSPNGNRMLTFTQGSSTQLTNTSFPSFIGSGPVSYFLVEYNMTASTGNPGPFGYSSGPNSGLVFQFNPGSYSGSSSVTVYYAGLQPFYDATTYDVPFYSPVPRISYLSVPNTGSGMVGFVNGLSKSVGSQSAGTYSGTFTVGSSPNGYISGNICELLIFNRTLTSVERQQIEGYLAQKWYVIRPPSIGFLPTSITGCQLWLDGSDFSTMTFSGSTITQWNDKSGNNRNTSSYSGTPILTTINNVQAISFNGSSDFTGSITGSGTALTLCIVGTRTAGATTAGGVVCFGRSGQPDWNDVGSVAITNGDSTIRVMLSTRTANSQTTYIGAEPYIFILIFDGTNVNTYIDGLVVASAIGNTGTFAYTYYVIGNRAGNTGTFRHTGSIGEVIVFNSALSTTHRNSVEQYLANKWRLKTLIPFSISSSVIHPYYSIKPRLRVFQPTDISSCILWLDSSDRATLTGSSTITAIADKSGSGAITTAYGGTPTLSNINGIPALYYDGSTYIRGSWNGTSYTGCNATIFVVASMVDDICYNAFQVGGNNTASPATINTTMGTNVVFNYGASIVLYDNNIYTLTNGPITGTTGLNANEAVMIRIQPAFGNPFMYVNRATFVSAFISGTSAGQGNSNVITGDILLNGDDVSNTTTGTGNSMTYGWGPPTVYSPNISNWIIGAGIQGPAGYWKGTVGEVIVFSNSLTVSEIKRVEGYLASKWKLTSAYPIAITPLLVSNCILWLDAADSSKITGSSPVTAWLDKSSNAYSFSGTGAVTSNLGSAANRSLFFNGSSYLTNNSMSITNPLTIFTVGYQTSNTGTWQRLLNGLSNTNYNNLLFLGCLASNVAVFIGNGSVLNDSNSNVPATNSLSNWTLITTTISAGTVITYANGNTLNSKSANTMPTITGFNIGGGAGGLTNTAVQQWVGHIGEVIVYSGVLSTAQRQSIEGYLSNKWKIRLINTLSASHPFRRLPSSTVTLPNFKELTYTGNDYNVYFAKYSSDGEVLWALRWTATGGILIRDIATDSRGNVYVSGLYVNSSLLMYDINRKLVRTLLNSGGYDGVIAKYSSSGTLLWTSRHVNAVTTYPTAIDVDSSGNVYTGILWDGASVIIYSAGEASSNAYGSTGGFTDGLVIKYNSSGIVQWSAKIVSSSYDAGGFSIKTDSSENVYAVGGNNLAPTFYNANGTSGGSLLWGGSVEAIWLAKWNSSGTFQWALRFVTGDLNGTRGALSIDSSANLYVSAAYDSTLTLKNTGDGTAATMTNSGGYDAFLVKYSSAGSYIWNARVGGTGSSHSIANAIDGSGNVYIMASYTDTVIVYTSGEASSITLSNSGGNDNLIAKYTSAGVLLWATRIASSGNESYRGLSVDPDGNVYAHGGYEGTVTFFNAGGTSAGTLSNTGADTYLAKYNTNGQYLWSARITGSGSDNGEASAADANGNIYVGGIYNSSPLTLFSA